MATLKSSFYSLTEARKAMEILKEKGFSNVFLDAADITDVELSSEINPPGTSKGPSLSALVFKSSGGTLHPEKNPLLASHPMASGLEPSREAWASVKTNLIVKAGDDRMDEAQQILRQSGGNIRI